MKKLIMAIMVVVLLQSCARAYWWETRRDARIRRHEQSAGHQYHQRTGRWLTKDRNIGLDQ